MLRQIINFFLLLFGIGKIGKEDKQIDPTGIDQTQQDQPENPEHQEETYQNEQQNNMYNPHSKLMIHLDNGHASTTPGKRSPGALIHLGYGNHSAEELSLYEYEYNRIIVDKVNKRLKDLGFQTYIVTPEVDNDIDLTVRANRSNSMAAKHPELKHIFVSAHVNACGNGKVWYNGNNASYWAAFTSKGQTTGDKLADCFYDAAEEILPKYGKHISTEPTDGDRDWEANFTVLTNTNVPATLVESLFMTNVDDVLFLKSEEGTEAIVEIYVRAICKYFDRYVK